MGPVGPEYHVGLFWTHFMLVLIINWINRINW